MAYGNIVIVGEKICLLNTGKIVLSGLVSDDEKIPYENYNEWINGLTRVTMTGFGYTYTFHYYNEEDIDNPHLEEYANTVNLPDVWYYPQRIVWTAEDESTLTSVEEYGSGSVYDIGIVGIKDLQITGGFDQEIRHQNPDGSTWGEIVHVPLKIVVPMVLHYRKRVSFSNSGDYGTFTGEFYAVTNAVFENVQKDQSGRFVNQQSMIYFEGNEYDEQKEFDAGRISDYVGLIPGALIVNLTDVFSG